MQPILHPSKLQAWLSAPELVIIDARGGPDARDRYQQGHIAGALFVDLETELSARKQDPAQGGRHPLPEPQAFARTLQLLGITPESTIVVYDDKHGANAAARFWWMMKAIGHQEVYVLDGGYQPNSWEGILVETGEVKRKPASTLYQVTNWQLPKVNLSDVEQASQQSISIIIDVREAYRYRGEGEPFDLVAGHIPGAVNLPYFDNLDSAGFFKSADELRRYFVNAIKEHGSKPVIVHCGSGVTACHTLLAMEEAGITGASLYVGSWSEWSRNEKPIATSTKQ